jgi:hypothetical protein
MGVVSPDEWVVRYAESALISAVRLRRYWLSQGYSEREAVRRAVKQAVGMMASSGLGPEKLLELFKELQKACDSFIAMLEKVIEESSGVSSG